MFCLSSLTCAKTNFALMEEEFFDVHQSKFPMVFLPEAISCTHGKERKYRISQGQFLATAHHTQANGIHSNPDNKEGSYETYQTLSLEEKQIELLESVHKQCNWVVCLDKAIDRDMLEKYLTKSGNKIVGFTTGEGSYGELNVTVSAKKVVLNEIKNLLKRRIEEKFSHWNQEQLAQASDFCVEKLTPQMDGSRILKALNPYDYEVHSYLAYTLMIQKLGMTQTDDNFFMRRLISLDSYLHWFDPSASTTEEKTRPDFMLIEIPKTAKNLDPNAPLELSLRVIECKMGFLNDDHVDKARIQLENGLNTLISHWDGDKEDIKLRYWLNQLYRVLIFLPLQVEDSSPEYGVLCRKIRGIIHGNYELTWSAALYGFWLNLNEEGFQETVLSFTEPVLRGDDNICEFDYYYCGQLEIQKLLLPPNQRNEGFDYVEVAEDDGEDELGEEVLEEDFDPILDIEIPSKPTAEKMLPPEPQVLVPQEPVVLPPEPEILVAIPEEEDDTPVVDTLPEQAGKNTEEVPVPSLEQVRFLIGEDMKSRQKQYWEFGHKGLTNRHLLINGNSGCGKTYCIQTLLMEAAKQGISSVVFDYTSVLSKIQAFIDIDVFLKDKTFDWAQLRDSSGTVYVIQLQGYNRDVQMMLTELLLWDVRNFAVSQGREENPFILVMDEAQNLDFSEKSPSAFLLTEGRKRGVSAWYATQFMKPQLSDDEIQRLQQAAQKLYFCPPDDGVMTIAKSIDINLTNAKDWAERLKKLKKGECVIDGQMVDRGTLIKAKPRIVSVTSLEDRL